MTKPNPKTLHLLATAAAAGALTLPASAEVVSLRVEQPLVPALVGRADNPVARLIVETRAALTLTELHISLQGTSDLDDVERVEVGSEDGARLGPARPAADALVFRGELPLSKGRNAVHLFFGVSRDADLDHVLDVGCTRARFSDGSTLTPEVAHPPGAQRLGLALRDAGDDGAAVHRIPGLVTTPEGTLLAAYDVRWRGWSDLPGDVDVGLSRSTDGGRSWEPMRIILDMGRDPEFAFDGVGDPAILVDGETGTVWVAALWSHGDRGWHGSGPGLAPEETGQIVMVRSDDDGRTWSDPVNITASVKRPEWSLLLQGPGRGITTADGTLVFTAQYRDAPDRGRVPHATLLFSRDRGESWQLGTGAKPDTTESQVVELEDGLLMLNMRDDRGGWRSVATTRDMGRSWKEHPTSRTALVDPVCNAGLLRAGERTLLFSNPAVSRGPRRRMTLRVSPDLGATWPEARRLVLDEGESAGYSSLTMIDTETVGVLFEGSRAQLTFMRVPLSALDP